MAKFADIPYEIWLIIKTFLPDGEVCALYSVNRTLFELGMDTIYCSVGITSPVDKGTRKCLDRLVQPRMVERIRSLSLRPTEFGVLLDATERKARGVRNKTAKGKKGDMMRPASYSDAQTLLEIMRTATKVVNFTIQCHGRDYFSGFHLSSIFISTAWVSFGSNLRALALDVPVEAIQLVLPPFIWLENLEELTLDLAVAYRSTLTIAEMRSSLLPFINQHSDTLKSLSITTWDSINLSPLLEGVAFMPHLTKISFRPVFVGMTNTDTSGLAHFLSKHAENIEDLTIHFRKPMIRFHQPDITGWDMFLQHPSSFMKYPEPDIWFTQSIFHVELPHLRKLDISMSKVPMSYASGMIAYVLRSKKELTHLTLHDLEFSSDQVNSLIVPLGKEGKIKYLMISVSTFSPGLLDMIVKRLPSLEELNLTAQRRAGDFDFYWDLSNRSYGKWGLRRISLNLKLIQVGIDGVKFREALVRCLPCVKTFNGQTPDAYVTALDLL